MVDLDSGCGKGRRLRGEHVLQYDGIIGRPEVRPTRQDEDEVLARQEFRNSVDTEQAPGRKALVQTLYRVIRQRNAGFPQTRSQLLAEFDGRRSLQLRP